MSDRDLEQAILRDLAQLQQKCQKLKDSTQRQKALDTINTIIELWRESTAPPETKHESPSKLQVDSFLSQ